MSPFEVDCRASWTGQRYPTHMLTSSHLVAFVATSDMERARQFYAGSLGLRMVEQTPFALVFDAQGTMLRVTSAAKVTPAPYTVLGWSVTDIAATIGSLEDRGVSFDRHAGMEQDRQGTWTSPSGARVAWFTDPDGNVLSLTQF